MTFSSEDTLTGQEGVYIVFLECLLKTALKYLLLLQVHQREQNQKNGILIMVASFNFNSDDNIMKYNGSLISPHGHHNNRGQLKP